MNSQEGKRILTDSEQNKTLLEDKTAQPSPVHSESYKKALNTEGSKAVDILGLYGTENKPRITQIDSQKKTEIRRTKTTGKIMTLLGIAILIPASSILINRMSHGFDGRNISGFGSMEIFYDVPVYFIAVVAGIILVLKGIETILSNKEF